MGNLRVQIEKNISQIVHKSCSIYIVNAGTRSQLAAPRSQSAACVEERKDTFLPASYRINL